MVAVLEPVSSFTDLEPPQVRQAAASQERVVDEIRLIGVPVEVQGPDPLRDRR